MYLHSSYLQCFFHWYCTKVDGYLACLNDLDCKELDEFKETFEKMHVSDLKVALYCNHIVTFTLGNALFQDEYKEKKTFCTKLEKWLELLKKLKKDLEHVSSVMKHNNMVV